MADVYFTVIIYVDHEELLEQSLKNIVNTCLGVKVIVVDALCTPETISICKKYKLRLGENHFVYFKTYRMSIGDAYNAALPEIEGRYVNFSLASIKLDKNALNAVWNVAEDLGRPKLISLNPWTVNEKGEYVQYKMTPNEKSDFYEQINLNDEPERLQLMFNAYFIRCYLIRSKERQMYFHGDLHEDALMEMCLNLLAEFRKYVYLHKTRLNYTNQLEDNTSAFLGQHHKYWYTDAVKNWIIPFALKWSKKDWPLRVSMRIALLYCIFVRFNCNYNDRNKNVLTPEERDEFYKYAGMALQFVDNEYIYKKRENQKFTIPRTMRVFFIKLKAAQSNQKCEVILHENVIYLWTHRIDMDISERTIQKMDVKYPPSKENLAEENKAVDVSQTTFVVRKEGLDIPEFKNARNDDTLCRVAVLDDEHVLIKALNYENEKLAFDGTFSLGDFFDNDKIKLHLYKDNHELPVHFSECYGLNRVFGQTYNRKFNFSASVPVSLIVGTSKIYFMVEVNGVSRKIQIRGDTVYAHFSHNIKNQYWRLSDNITLRLSDKRTLLLERTDIKKITTMEQNFQKELKRRADTGDSAAGEALEIRKQYFTDKKTLEDSGRRIWITFDKLYKAGDNGEYIYQYALNQDDEVDLYYIIKSDSRDYGRLAAQNGKLLIWGKRDTLIKILLAETILTTHANVFSYSGFEKSMRPYVCDLFQAQIVCIQHGLTVQDIAQYQNRWFDNLQLYILASPNEYNNLSRPIYGFKDKSPLRLTGSPRYDGLKNNDKKQILITPTWRRNIANSDVAHFKKGHNEYFRESEYYKIYNSLINDKRLIECARKTGYRVIYLLHPAASAQINDFERNDYVELVAGAEDTNYEKILTESSLMVTDYSGVQFDFAYMRKPILYYHPDTLPAHYAASKAYQYDTMAFGPIIKTHDELVAALCEYMKTGCSMKPEYIERADRFFAYKDFNNCERVYSEVLDFLNERRAGQ